MYCILLFVFISIWIKSITVCILLPKLYNLQIMGTKKPELSTFKDKDQLMIKIKLIVKGLINVILFGCLIFRVSDISTNEKIKIMILKPYPKTTSKVKYFGKVFYENVQRCPLYCSQWQHSFKISFNKIWVCFFCIYN